MRHHLLTTLVLAVAATGCAQRHPSTSSNVPQPNPKSKVATDVDDRLKAVRELTDQLLTLTRSLPAASEADERTRMAQAFDLSARILPLLMGPDADGQFRLQQRIVADARDRLARTSGDRLALEPTVDAGLRAIYNALVRISQESFYTSQPVTADITELGARADALDTVRGPAHRQASADALATAAATMDRMARIYAARLKNGPPEPAAPNPK